MNLPFIDSQTFKHADYSSSTLPKGEYDNCKFENCNFENSDISNNSFLECEFINCNFSNVNVMHTQFKDVYFSQCKMVGVQFQNTNSFLRSFSFKDCILDFASFTAIKIDNTLFDICKLIGVDFTDTKAKKVIFKKSDLHQATFNNTNLEFADFSSAFNFQITPSQNKLKKAIFTKENLSGLLHSSGITIIS